MGAFPVNSARQAVVSTAIDVGLRCIRQAIGTGRASLALHTACDPTIRAGAIPACFGTEVAHAVGIGIAAISAFTGLACVATTIDPRFGAILYAIAAREIVIATASPGTARWRVYSAGLCVLPCTAVLP